MSRHHSSGELLADRRFAYAQDCLAEGDAQAAVEMAEQALELAPHYAPAWFLLGRAREARFATSGEAGDEQAARSAYACALDIDPDDTLGARLHLAGLGMGDVLAAITPAYVRALFDGYAPRFERHLVDGLGYRGPDLIVAALDALPDAPARFATGLDLGCGTGLMGKALAGRVAHLTGIDLSPAMLALARRSGSYARLCEGELTAFLADEPPVSTDLVVAADVMIYLPDLRPVFTGIGRVLRPGALALVSVQSQDGPDVVLGSDGRYAHGDVHLRAAASKSGLTLAAMPPAAVRQERGQDVPGRIAVLRKPW
ncbi:class I SAM-dependent DNA methyltransferase [Methylobacterium haplocladii]|uniref:Methyltransferase n=1 Tax=Methylobacterium haplocladii TaxID=1176176 RepID=A0A512IJA9_9HYPH|nr:methyltransferase domain-containing protein [Methylobacterium haplocladii]GEO97762.1 methyltransferase [Methylobacterium haplocladii]GJD82609.1 Trans-aconitate 2-methyltransferase [Methylobacterium haplocladii]GLS57605.1 methyltransferase [Methylobacterium haplocladii]